MSEHNMDHMNHLEAVAAADVAHLREKEATYKGSWKRRGGAGAFFMLARKWDRLEGMLSVETVISPPCTQYNVFEHIAADPSGDDGSPLAEIRDLRRYLLLVEAEMVSRGVVASGVESNSPDITDSNRHAKQEYLMDGMKATDYPTEVYCITTRVGVAIVDRSRTAPEKWGHLPRLALELNHQEWKETQPEYQWMYSYEEAAGKYVLGSRWREHWGRQP